MCHCFKTWRILSSDTIYCIHVALSVTPAWSARPVQCRDKLNWNLITKHLPTYVYVHIYIYIYIYIYVYEICVFNHIWNMCVRDCMCVLMNTALVLSCYCWKWYIWIFLFFLYITPLPHHFLLMVSKFRKFYVFVSNSHVQACVYPACMDDKYTNLRIYTVQSSFHLTVKLNPVWNVSTDALLTSL